PDVRAGLDLGHPVARPGDLVRTGAGGRADAHLEPGALDRFAAVAQARHRLEALRPPLLGRVHVLEVALVALQPLEPQAGQPRDPLGQRRGRRAGRDAAAVLADVHLDDHAQAQAGRLGGGGELLGVRRVVDDHHHLGVPRQADQADDLRRADHLARDQDAVDPALDHRLGLGELRAADADRAGVELLARDERRLVRLGVRAHRLAAPPAPLGHPRDVPLEPDDVDDQRRRVELLQRPADRDQGHRRHLQDGQCTTSIESGMRCRPSRARRRSRCGRPAARAPVEWRAERREPMPPVDQEVRVRAETLRGYAAELLVRADVPAADAALTAETLVESDLRNVTSHGTRALPRYLRSLRAGGTRPRPNVTTVREGPAFAVLDGDAGLGQVVAHQTMTRAIEIARRSGVGAVAVANSNHY